MQAEESVQQLGRGNVLEGPHFGEPHRVLFAEAPGGGRRGCGRGRQYQANKYRQVARHIDVKGRAGDGEVALTKKEWSKAQGVGQDYWLYIGTACKSEAKLPMIQDQGPKLRPKGELKIVRHIIGGADGKRAAEAESAE